MNIDIGIYDKYFKDIMSYAKNYKDTKYIIIILVSYSIVI